MEGSTKIVHLNVGGKKVNVGYQTLLQIPYFEKRLRDWEKDPEQTIFIDYDYQRLRPILNWLRNKMVKLTRENVPEIHFFGVVLPELDSSYRVTPERLKRFQERYSSFQKSFDGYYSKPSIFEEMKTKYTKVIVPMKKFVHMYLPENHIESWVDFQNNSFEIESEHQQMQKDWDIVLRCFEKHRLNM